MQQAVRDSLIAFMAALSQAQAEAMKEARRAGIAHAKSLPDAKRKFRGRKPSYTRAQFDATHAMLAQGAGLSAISRETGLSRAAIWRIKTDPASCEAALALWGE
jgi:DNA invertase Pin-like site-specific DNA recombinase